MFTETTVLQMKCITALLLAVIKILQTKLIRSIQYSYKKFGTHARVGSLTITNGNRKIEGVC